MLTADIYDRAETEACARLPALAIQAFSPSTFLGQNYPVRIDREQAILRYADTMHNTSGAKYYDDPGYRYSAREAEVIRDVAQVVADMTGRRFGHTVRPWMAPFSAVEPLRAITAFAEAAGKKHLSIVEIGPGSGYLGAFLLRLGHRYLSMDNTQGFYLWQSRLMEELAGERFHEMAQASEAPVPDGAQAVHMPWWAWAAMGETPPIQADIVVCDHALGEMDPVGLRFNLNAARRFLAGGGAKLFLFFSPGLQRNTDMNGIGRALQMAGFRLVFRDRFWGFTPIDSDLAAHAVESLHMFHTHWRWRLKKLTSSTRNRTAGTPFDRLNHPIPPLGGTADIPATDILAPTWAEAPMDYSFLRLAGYRIPPAR